tara:strand:+ start:511 stop:714 length:204 start_codon:yes stop_codon:yes gene_type:complete
MNWKEIEEKRAMDVERRINSLSWLTPIAENMLMHMSSDELYEFIHNTLVAKQMNLAELLLTPPKEDE